MEDCVKCLSWVGNYKQLLVDDGFVCFNLYGHFTLYIRETFSEQDPWEISNPVLDNFSMYFIDVQD